MATFTVTNTNDSGEGSLREAIDLANERLGADTISFASSLSGETIELTSGELVIDNQDDLTIGAEDSNVTIDALGLSKIFYVPINYVFSDFDLTISGLTLTGGRGAGAAIDNDDASLELNNVTIIRNNAESGSVLRSFEGDLTLNSSVITGNRGQNAISTGTGNRRNKTEINDSSISENYSSGISNYNSDLVVNDSTISSNTSAGIISFGFDTLAVNRSTIRLNDFSGIVLAEGSDANIVDSTISGNKAEFGGGIYVSDSEAGVGGLVTIQNSTISNNEAEYGGGIFADGANIDVVNSTIGDNSAAQGGGIYVSDRYDDPSEIKLVSTIVADNVGSLSDPDLFGDGVSASNSLIETFSTIDDLGGNLLGVDPELDPRGLTDNGGPTLTIGLQPDSPAINAGSNPLGLPNDQRGSGFDRTVDGQVDIGAFEVQDLGLVTTLDVGLYDADTDTLITTLEEGTSILASNIEGRGLSIAALVPDNSPFSDQVESVFLDLNQGEATRAENSEPYSLFGDISGDFAGGSIPTGTNTVSFDLYSENGLGGDLLGTVDRTFTIVDDLTGLDIGLFDADTDERIATLFDGTEIDASQITGRSVNIAAFVPQDSPFAGQVESMFLNLNQGEVTRTENSEPYALFGDVGGDFFGGSISTGDNTIAFDLYSENSRQGDLIDTVIVDFAIV